MEYFPFGETFIEERNDAEYTNYLYNGKELDEETGLYYYGARYYDARTSVWASVDPLAEKYFKLSPYSYCANNPIIFVDPNGMEIKYIVRDNNGKPKEILKYRNGNFWHANGDRYNPGKESLGANVYKTLATYRKIESSGDKVLTKELKTLETSKKIHFVEVTNDNGRGSDVHVNENGKSRSEEEQMIKKGIPVGSHTCLIFRKRPKITLKMPQVLKTPT